MAQRRSGRDRGLVMPAGRRIPRVPPEPPRRPPPPGETDEVPVAVAKAAGELTELAARIRTCEGCGRACAERAYGSGFPRAPVMLVKDRPSADDVSSATAFTSEAEPLAKAFEALGVPLARVYGATAVRCGTGAATADELAACAEHLLTEIEAVRPQVLIAFGDATVEAVRALDGRCGISVPESVDRGRPTQIRADLVMLATEPLPDGVTAKEAKRRLWRDLQTVAPLVR